MLPLLTRSPATDPASVFPSPVIKNSEPPALNRLSPAWMPTRLAVILPELATPATLPTTTMPLPALLAMTPALVRVPLMLPATLTPSTPAPITPSLLILPAMEPVAWTP